MVQNKQFMKLELLVIGKIKQDFLFVGITEYEKRINHFIKFGVTRLPSIKIKSQKESEIIRLESEKIQSKINSSDNVILLEVLGEKMDTIKFSNFVEKKINRFPAKTIFIIGGAYGVNDELRMRANHILSMSTFTFTHDMAQLILVEQIYRAYTVINNIPYHH